MILEGIHPAHNHLNRPLFLRFFRGTRRSKLIAPLFFLAFRRRSRCGTSFMGTLASRHRCRFLLTILRSSVSIGRWVRMWMVHHAQFLQPLLPPSHRQHVIMQRGLDLIRRIVMTTTYLDGEVEWLYLYFLTEVIVVQWLLLLLLSLPR